MQSVRHIRTDSTDESVMYGVAETNVPSSGFDVDQKIYDFFRRLDVNFLLFLLLSFYSWIPQLSFFPYWN